MCATCGCASETTTLLNLQTGKAVAMNSAADLFTAAGLQPAAPISFRAAFLDDLRKYEISTASATRERHAIPGDNTIGSDILALEREGIISRFGTEQASGLSSHGRLTRRWRLTRKGRESEAGDVR